MFLSLMEANFTGLTNLLTIYQALTGQQQGAIEAQFADQGYGTLKKAVTEVVIETLKPIQDRYYEMAADPGYIDRVLKESADRIRPIAENRLRVAQEKLGVR